MYPIQKTEILNRCNEVSKNTLMETLQINYTDVGENFLVAQMPVTSRVHQPMGLLHGGATVALAESVGSAASMLFTNAKTHEIRGIEISANHLRSVKEGIITAKATLIHQGKTLHLWEIKVTDTDNKLISICKLTNIVLEKKDV